MAFWWEGVKRKRQKRRTCQLSEEGEDKQIVAHSLLFIELHRGEVSLFLKPVICHCLSNLFLHCAIFHYVWADASVCYQALKKHVFFKTVWVHKLPVWLMKTGSGMRKSFPHTLTHGHAVCKKNPTNHKHMRLHTANQTLLPLLTHTRSSPLLFFLRFLLPAWDWLAIRRCIYHICQLLSLYRSSSLCCHHICYWGKHSVKSERVWFYCETWPIWESWHIVLLSDRSSESSSGYWLAVFCLQLGSIWQSSRFWNIKLWMCIQQSWIHNSKKATQGFVPVCSV